MKRFFPTMVFFIITIFTYAQEDSFILSGEKEWCYNLEMVNVTLNIPPNWISAHLSVELQALEGQIHIYDEKISEGFEYDTVTNESIAIRTTRYRIIPLTEAPVKLQAKIHLKDGQTFLSNVIDYQVLPQPQTDGEPYINVHSLTENFVAGKPINVLVEVFSEDYQSGSYLDYKFPENMRISITNALKGKTVYLTKQSHRRMKAYPLRIIFNEPGDYTLLPDEMELEFINPENEKRYNTFLPVIQETFHILPADSTNIDPAWLDISYEFSPEKWEKGTEVKLGITLKSNGMISHIDSLLPFSNLPSFLEEENNPSWFKWINDEMIEGKTYYYRGIVPKITGVDLKSIKIPGEVYAGEDTVLSFDRIEGNFNPISIISFLFIMFLTLFGITIFVYFTITRSKQNTKEKEVNKEAEANSEKDFEIKNVNELHYFSEEFGLTNRERDVLKVLVEGKSTKEIADELYISPDTAKKHINNIMNKTETHSRLEIFVLLDGFLKKEPPKTEK
jgi:DNA-binding CsgD family transcriptional regulator